MRPLFLFLTTIVVASACGPKAAPPSEPTSETVRGLATSATPHPDAPAELGKLSGLVGTWTCTPSDLQQDGTYVKRNPATWSFFYGLNGYALIDEWTGQSPTGKKSVGINIRHVDPDTGKWTARWLVSAKLKWDHYDADVVESPDEGLKFVMEGDMISPNGNAGRARITFHDITTDAFHWSLDWSVDGGETWIPRVVVIDCVRR